MKIAPIRTEDILTPTGRMRTRFFEPLAKGPRPAVVLYSEIYQMTAPIARTAAMLAGHGYIVAVPDVYHEYTELGEVFAYDKPGTDRGNLLKITKPVEHFDSDASALIEYCLQMPHCTGRLGTMGICLGGHLAFRAAMHPSVAAGVCFYATDIHSATLGLGKCDDTLKRIPELKAEMLMVWGRQDPHIPVEGRRKIYEALSAADVMFTWLEFNGEHAFMRDEGHRYDPELSQHVMQMVYSHLENRLKS